MNSLSKNQFFPYICKLNIVFDEEKPKGLRLADF
jgi:hypothetical protein